MPRCLIVAGPNGAGKTTFARRFLPSDAVTRFVNADLLAAGLSPLEPSAARRRRKVVPARARPPGCARADFAFESTLSRIAYVHRLHRWKAAGYDIEIFYLRLDDVRLSLERIAARVRSGGHDVPEADARRRFTRSWINFTAHYQPLATATWVFDVNGPTPILLAHTP